MSRKEPRETNSGVKKKGDWDEIAEFAREVEDAVKDSDLDESEVKEYNEWRPREEETEQDIKKKTAEKAAIKVPREDVSIVNETEKAGKELARAGEKAANFESPRNNFREGIRHFVGGIVMKSASYMRSVEQRMYRSFMLRFNPYFYDTQDLAVDMRSSKKGEYQMDVSVTKDEARENLKERFREN
ncbi:MAG: hypothetical protein ACI977_000862 [Candidatus Nanohaloarchaea archaeon]|jgi:hypothetical protein